MNLDTGLDINIPEGRRYRIADYIPHEYKLKMMAVNYAPTGSGHIKVLPRCANGKCPLGWLFDGDGIYDDSPPTPYVARRLTALNVSLNAHDVYEAAADFIYDWDRGLVADLRVALGL